MENKADLEQLLNSLIEKGWKPFGINHYCSFYIRERIEILGGPFGGGEYLLSKVPSFRELVSKESGLWQFVCEKKLVKRTPTMWERYNADTGKKYGFYDDHSTYRLIESSLKDESELEDFLLNSISLHE